MNRIRLALASAITCLLVLAGGVVTARTFGGPATLGFVVGGRAAGAASVVATASPLGPFSAPLSDPRSLEMALAATGYRLPPGASVYAAKVTEDAGGLNYDDYEGGGGALAGDFWPASSIKVLAAVGALEFVGQLGFTGAATVVVGQEAPRSLRSIYDSAIRDSSNDDYDLLVRIAGVDWLNTEFLTVARGFPETVIQRSYTLGGTLRRTPALVLAEDGRTVTVAARTGRADPDCPQGNCSDLFEMSESVRRVVLHDEIPESERFRIHRSDAAALRASLLGAEGWFEPAVARVLGDGARIYGKPGYVPGGDCMDVALIDAPGRRLLLSATVPVGQGGCPALVTLATNVLRFLTG